MDFLVLQPLGYSKIVFEFVGTTKEDEIQTAGDNGAYQNADTNIDKCVGGHQQTEQQAAAHQCNHHNEKVFKVHPEEFPERTRKEKPINDPGDSNGGNNSTDTGSQEYCSYIIIHDPN